MICVFGKSPGAMSRLMKQLRVLLYEAFSPGMRQPLPLSHDVCASFSSAIERKSGMRGIVAFIDGTVRPITKPGILQGAQYNGKDRVHALKYQAVSTPDGIIAHLGGPYPGSRHDQFMLHESKIMSWVRSFPRQRDGQLYALYADAGYSDLPGLETPFADGLYNREHQALNEAMAAARISVEWEFGALVSTWAELNWKVGQQLLSKRRIGQVYFVSAFLSNCLCCLRPSKTCMYFRTAPPSIFDYVEGVLQASAAVKRNDL